MITRAEVEKLGALHAVEPVMLSLYLAVPPPPADPAALTVRVGELITAAEENAGQAVPAQDRDRVLEQLPSCARDWPGHTVAIFACADSGLLQVIPLPCPLPERGVLGVRPHIRPLLLARQRGPAYHVAPEDQAGLPACLAAVSTGQVRTLVVPADGLVPGYECGRCGTLSLDAGGRCPDWGTAALPVPDVIEEMVSRVLEDGGDVVIVCDASSPVAVRLRRLPGGPGRGLADRRPAA